MGVQNHDVVRLAAVAAHQRSGTAGNTSVVGPSRPSGLQGKAENHDIQCLECHFQINVLEHLSQDQISEKQEITNAIRNTFSYASVYVDLNGSSNIEILTSLILFLIFIN